MTRVIEHPMRVALRYLDREVAGIPIFPPDGWRLIQEWGDGYALDNYSGLRVLVDTRAMPDESIWLHVSYSRAKWIPNHADTSAVKQAFIGNRYAYAIFPPSEKYVNIHPNCLHLWAPLSVDSVTPEFSENIEGVGLSI